MAWGGAGLTILVALVGRGSALETHLDGLVERLADVSKQLQGMRNVHQHGFDVKRYELELEHRTIKNRLANHSRSDVDQGIAVTGDGHLEPSDVHWSMNRGYRVFESLHPPWDAGKSKASLSKDSVLEFIHSIKAVTKTWMSSIHEDYGSGNQKHNFADKLFPQGGKEKGLAFISSDVEQRLASRMLSAMLQPDAEARRFTIAFTGHSNLAGHGNYFDMTYPFVMGRKLAVPFHAAGISLAVQNFAAGGTATLPTTGWCGEQQVGDAVDVGVWDFDMTEQGKSEAQGEAWIRSFLSLPHPAAGLLFMKNERAKRWSSGYGAHVAIHSLEKVDSKMPLAENSTDFPEAIRWLHPDCSKFGDNGAVGNTYCRQEKWAPAKQEMKWRLNKAKGKLESGVWRGDKQVAGSCPGMVPWHDGHKLHQLKGSLLAHFYARCMLQAAGILAKTLDLVPDKSASDPAAVQNVLERLRRDHRVQSPPLPKAGRDCSQTPQCSAIGKLACITAVEPTVAKTLVAMDQRGQALNRSIDKPNTGKKKDEEACHMGFIDYKYSIAVEASHGWVSFKLPDYKKDGSIIVCEPQTGWHRDATMAELQTPKETIWKLGNSDLKPPSQLKVMKECFEFQNVRSEGGDQVLQVKTMSTSKVARISHVVWRTHKD